MNTLLLPIAKQFAHAVKQINPLGNGLINDTYLVTTQSSSFVLQRINRTVFPAPEQIMANLSSLTQHIAQKNSAQVKLQIPAVLKTANNESLYQDENGDCWRALSFIANTESLEIIQTIGDAEQVGFALGHFHRLINDLNPLLLHDTLPGFHITPEYLKHYQRVLAQPTNPATAKDGGSVAIGREPMRQNRYCAEFIARFQPIADDLEAARRKGLLPLRVIHGDPKLNNFLFDKGSKKIVSIIDLDTVKPGLIHYDIGDCVRSCSYIATPQGFDLDISAALLKSYLAEVGAFFTEHDYHYLYPAIRLIPFELGIRFYTDYLEGNRYFKVTEPEQNLQRAIDQFRLCERVIALEFTLIKLITQLKRSH
ncbi:MAG: aminoglycoside phosphotransferase family protein [Methylococcaceae bacterium]